MAGAGKKTFTAGEVLTASDVNTFLMEQSVMVFGGTAARSSAIPTPSTGMTSYRTDAKQIESYNGSAWVGMGGLQLIKTQTIGSGVSSVTVTGAFDATYDAYKIVITGGALSTPSDISVTLGASTSNYQYSLVYNTWSNGTIGSVTSGSQGITNKMNYLIYGHPNGIDCDVDILNPYLTKWTFCRSQVTGDSWAGTISATHKDTGSYSSFTLTPVGGTLTGGTIAVYGYGIN